MAVRVLDLRKQPGRSTFTGTPKDEIRYAEAFWQSVRLQPTMESRLVSSDIKQRLGRRTASGKSGSSAEQCASKSDKKLSELFTRARTLDQIEKFERLRRLAEARIQDRNRLHKRREERISREQISRDKLLKPVGFEVIAEQKAILDRKFGEAYSIAEMIQEIDDFERKKYGELQSKEERLENVDLSLGQSKQPLLPDICVKLLPLSE
ncbi:hypothetical protein BsWGS_28520 [Bradybaena similaris]